MKKQIFKLALLVVSLLPTVSLAQNLDAHFKQLSALEKIIFLKAMPKGGELHFHLAGSATPETMLQYKSDLCLNQRNWSVSKNKQCALTLSSVSEQPGNYQQVIEAWSLENFVKGPQSTTEHFFSTFLKFQPLIAEKRPQILADLRREAADQNELYLETMITPDDHQVLKFAHLIKKGSSIKQAVQMLLHNAKFLSHVKQSVHYADKLVAQSSQILQCPGRLGCDVHVRFQYYILRDQPINYVITEATAAFLAANISHSIVGINLVQAENGIYSLKDYKKHMAIIKLLNKHFPKVNIALHAGELRPESVSPQDLNFHIRDAIHTAKANRIGHGTAIAYENKAKALLKYMAKNRIPVEINLTSNKKLLGISGEMHPINLYLRHGVPIVLSTDDEGILRTDLTREYFTAATEHHLNYSQLKQASRNALTFSFLQGKSLWQNYQKALPVAACKQLILNKRCQSYLANNEKAALQFQLEQRFKRFESQYN